MTSVVLNNWAKVDKPCDMWMGGSIPMVDGWDFSHVIPYTSHDDIPQGNLVVTLSKSLNPRILQSTQL